MGPFDTTAACLYDVVVNQRMLKIYSIWGNRKRKSKMQETPQIPVDLAPSRSWTSDAPKPHPGERCIPFGAVSGVHGHNCSYCSYCCYYCCYYYYYDCSYCYCYYHHNLLRGPAAAVFTILITVSCAFNYIVYYTDYGHYQFSLVLTAIILLIMKHQARPVCALAPMSTVQ